jgi:serine/threonine protein kinase/tetratricopeptide (TPR) repeat protein
MIGKTISHYKILGKLGEGGMGVVYKAEDTKLERHVALKFLSPRILGTAKERARFIHEAKAAAALNHPNICTIYEIDEADGQIFIAMECVEGQSLRAGIESPTATLDETLAITIQIAEGLAEAHAKGIVHRDIKPANVVVTPQGRVKIMDFGLALSSAATQVTVIGTTVGTVAYMSPEQARGGRVDHRTDIWSLGVILYEMIAGRRPFTGNRDQAVIYSILNEEPDPLSVARPGVSGELEDVVCRMLSKDPASRQPGAEEVLVDLSRLREARETVTSARPADARKRRPSIAVLPFLDMSPERDQEYFCEGMAEELINALTHIGGLKVSARTSSFQFKGPGHDIHDVGRKLRVDTVLEGSVRKAGNRLRITAQLISVADGYHVWSEKFDRDMEDVFAIQDEISLAIVDELKLELLGNEKARLVKRPTASPEAYNVYLRGRWFWNKRTHEGFAKAIECFERAIELAPEYAQAYAGVADCYTALMEYSASPPPEAPAIAKRAALKALEIDGGLAEAHASLGYIKMVHDWDWAGAEAEFRRAIELNPQYAPAHHRYAHYLVRTAGHAEALEEARRAQELEPQSLAISRTIGFLLCVAGEYDAAIDALERTLEMDPAFTLTRVILGVAYLKKSMYEDALAAFREEERVLGRWSPLAAAWIGVTHALSGNVNEAERALVDLTEISKHRRVPPSDIALLCFALARRDEGFNWLEKAYAERDVSLRTQLPVFRMLEIAGGDPRFTDLLRRMGLES